jgi:hypothetical protein
MKCFLILKKDKHMMHIEKDDLLDECDDLGDEQHLDDELLM